MKEKSLKCNSNTNTKNYEHFSVLFRQLYFVKNERWASEGLSLKPAAPPKQKRAKASHRAAAEPLALLAAAPAAPDAAAAEESREVKKETLHVI